jgi:hypothetical protein
LVAPVALVVAGCVTTSVASAQSPSLKDFLFPHRQEIAGLSPGRYVPSEGETFFVDRGGSGALLLRFGDSPEVWALKPVAGPRGDIIYKDDAGEDVLRATRLGGLTLFTSERPGGAPAAFAGDGPAIRPAAVGGTNALFQTLVQSSIRASRAAQHLIVFEAPDLSPRDTTAAASAILADAATVTAEAFTRLAGRGPVGRTVVARVARVQFQTGRDAQARTSGTVVTIIVSPEKGFAGRPSSARIITTLMNK